MLIGPSVDYATYDSLVTGRIYKTAPPGTGAEQEKATKRRTPYGRRRVAYLHFVIGLAFLGIYAVYAGRGSYARILGPDWSQWGLLTKFGFIQFAGFIARTKYYAVWSLSEVRRDKYRRLPKLTCRGRVSSPALGSTGTTLARAGRCGTGSGMSTSSRSRRPRASKLSLTAGTVGRMCAVLILGSIEADV
jgi:lysophospholipid acyltransferase